MATYNTVKKNYYKIANGKLQRYDGEGVVSEFTGIDGYLKDITRRNHTYNGEDRVFTDFQFVDGDEHFVVTCDLFGSVSNTIVRCLSNVKDFSKKILIEVYQIDKDGKKYTNVSVKQDGQRVPWCDIPPVESYQIPSGETVKSTKKREDFILGLIDDVRKKLGVNVAPAAEKPAAIEPDDDMPPADDYQPHNPYDDMPPAPDYPPYYTGR